jgi:hypothetical protein
VLGLLSLSGTTIAWPSRWWLDLGTDGSGLNDTECVLDTTCTCSGKTMAVAERMQAQSNVDNWTSPLNSMTETQRGSCICLTRTMGEVVREIRGLCRGLRPPYDVHAQHRSLVTRGFLSLS